MRKLLLACSIATIVVSANAATADGYDWPGFYGGFNVGYGAGEGDGDTSYLPDPATFDATPFSPSVDMDGVVAGIQGGHNWQFGNTVVGVEADASWSDINGDDTFSPLADGGGTPDPTWFQDSSGDLNWLATLRGRIGWLISPNTLLYGTGGVAYGEVEYETFTSFTPLPAFQYAGSASESRTGWTAGFGGEWAGAGSWSWRAEYLYYDLGSTDFVASPLAPNPPFAVTQDFDTTGSIVRFGANFEF